MVTGVRITNYKKIRDYKFTPGGKSFYVVGDTEEGKSTLIEVIESSLMMKKFDPNPLTNGTEAGSTEVDYDLGDGHTYTVKRKYNKKSGLLRFEVVDENGGEHKLKPLLERLFGLAFINKRFDYTAYFYQAKSSEARTEYFINAIGGDTVLLNSRKIKVRVKERQELAKDMEFYKVLIEKSILEPETLADDIEKYKEPKTLESVEEYAPYAELKAQLKDKDVLQETYEAVKQENELYDAKVARNAEIDAEILELQERIRVLKAEKKEVKKHIDTMPPDYEQQKKLEEELLQADQHNSELAPKIDEARRAGLAEINEFNQNRLEFNNAVEHYKMLMGLMKKYDEIETDVTALREKNKEAFKSRVPLPEITYDEDNELILYTGEDGIAREMCFPHVSKGRSITIAAQIQRALNPKGNNLIVIPEGQSLGSGLDSIVEELNNFGVQYIVEVTERKQKLSVLFEEEYLKK
jgi:hypothetical protein